MMQAAEYGSFYHPVSDGQTVSVRVGRHALRRGLRQIGSQRRMWPPAVIQPSNEEPILLIFEKFATDSILGAGSECL